MTKVEFLALAQRCGLLTAEQVSLLVALAHHVDACDAELITINKAIALIDYELSLN